MATILTPRQRGWGNGPGPKDSAQDVKFQKDNILTINPLIKRPSLGLRVHRDIAAPVSHLISHIELIHPLNSKQDDWGYANRPNKNDSKSTSWHAWGLAVDLDAAENPNGVRKTTLKPEKEVRKWAWAFGFRWGFDYHSTPDPMHFEYCGTRADAQYCTWYMAQSAAVQKKSKKPYVYTG